MDSEEIRITNELRAPVVKPSPPALRDPNALMIVENPSPFK